MQKLVSFLQESMDEYSTAEEQIAKQVNQYVEKIGVGKKSKEKGFFDKILDGVQVGLDVVGLIPVVGEIADGVNGSIYLARGDKLNAALSFAAMVPVVGSAATGAKYVNKGLKYGEEIADAGKTIKKPPNATDQLNQDSADALIPPIVNRKSSKGSSSETNVVDFNPKTATNKQKGNFGEIISNDNLLNNQGLKDAGYDLKPIGRYAPSSIDDKIVKGIDGLYESTNPNSPIKYVIDEAKFGNSQLSKTTKDGPQMSNDWLIGSNTGNNRILDAVDGDASLARKITKALRNNQVERVLSKVDSSGAVRTYKIDEFGKIKGEWP